MNGGSEVVTWNDPANPASASPSALLEGLGRLFVSTTIYPPAHPRVVELANIICEEARSGSAPEQWVLGLHPDGFSIQGEPIATCSGPLKRLYSHLNGLSLDEVAFQKSCPRESWIEFCARVLAAVRDTLTGTYTPEDWIASLPHGVTARTVSYGVPQDEESLSGGNARDRLMEAMLRPLQELNAPPAVCQDVHAFVDSVLQACATLAKRDARSSRPARANSIPQGELLDLVSLVIRKCLEAKAGESPEEFRLQEMFESFDRVFREVAGERVSEEVVRQLLSRAESTLLEHMRRDRKVPAGTERRSGTRPRVEEPASSVLANLESFVREEDKGAVHLDRTDAGLSVLLGYALGTESATASAAVRHLRRVLEESPCEAHVDLVLQALRDRREGTTLQAWDEVIRRLRDSLAPPLWEELLERLADSLDDAALACLWPHLPPLLFQSEMDQDAAIRLLSQVPVGVIRRDLGRLSRSLAASPPPGDAVRPRVDVPELWPLYGFLLEMPEAKAYHAPLAMAFRDTSLPFPEATALQVTDFTRPAGLRFLKDLLAAMTKQTMDAPLTRQAVQIMLSYFRDPRSIAGQDFLSLKLLQVLGQIGTPEALGLLRQIAASKSLFRASWPEALRMAARETLKTRDSGWELPR